MRNRLYFLAAALLLSGAPAFAADGQAARAAPAEPAAPAARQERPVPAIERVVVVSVDGLRPDLLLRAKTPNLHRLFETGSYTFWAQTVPLAVTLPSHTSMLTGVAPERHGVIWNGDQKPASQGYPKVPTLFDVAKRAGLTTAIATGKTKFAALARPGSVDWQAIASSGAEDVAKAAAGMLREHRPGVLFVHFRDVDSAGHAHGWGSPDQLAAIERVDAAVGTVLEAMDQAKLTDSTFVLVTADHGGAGRVHGPGDARSRHIPWIVNGPGVRRGYDLTSELLLVVRTEDTFATACHVLGLPLAEGLDGKPVRQAFEKGAGEKDTGAPAGELLHEAK